MAYGRRVAVAAKRRFTRRKARKLGRRTMSRPVYTKRGPRPGYLFHRYAVGIPAANINTSSCTYTTGTSVVSINSSVSEAQMAMYFTIGDLNNVTEFTNLFDQYMINMVIVTLKLVGVPEATSPPNTNTANYGNYYPTVWYSPDYDDNSATTITQLKEYQFAKHKVLRPNQELKIIIRPRTAQQLYRTSVTTGYAVNFKKQWVDCAMTDVPHYGLKMAFDLEGITSAIVDVTQRPQIKVNAKYYLACRNAR